MIAAEGKDGSAAPVPMPPAYREMGGFYHIMHLNLKT